MGLLIAHCRKWVDCFTSVDFLKGGGDHQVQNQDNQPVLGNFFDLTFAFGAFRTFSWFVSLQYNSTRITSGNCIQFLCWNCIWALGDILNVPIISMCDTGAQFGGNLMLMSQVPLSSPVPVNLAKYGSSSNLRWKSCQLIKSFGNYRCSWRNKARKLLLEKTRVKFSNLSRKFDQKWPNHRSGRKWKWSKKIFPASVSNWRRAICNVGRLAISVYGKKEHRASALVSILSKYYYKIAIILYR